MTFIPYANNYVVAEIDMEATLRDVWDPKVREEIQSMTPVKCLMYCETVSALLPPMESLTHRHYGVAH